MRKLAPLFLSLLIAATLIACTTAQQHPKEGWLWKISGNGLSQPSYLFGTYHGTYDILYGYVDSIPGFHQAFEACSQYVGEVIGTDDDLSAVTSQISSNIKMPKDTTYADLLNKEDYHFLDSLLQQMLKVHLNQMYVKPGYLGIILGQIGLRENLVEAGYSPTQIDSVSSQVMDMTLEAKAKEKGYTLIGLEALSEQITMLATGNSLKKQAAQLIALLRENDIDAQLSSFGDNLAQVYRSQDIKHLIEYEAKTDSLFQSMPELFGEYLQEVLLKRRNTNWMKKIPELIKDKSTFIAVGVRHLPGKDGLISLLREKGYKVEAQN